MDKKVKYPYFSAKFDELLKKTGVTLYRLDEDNIWRASNLSKIKKGTHRPTDEIINALASYEALNIDYETLLAWRMIDEYGAHIVRQAGQELAEEERNT